MHIEGWSYITQEEFVQKLQEAITGGPEELQDFLDDYLFDAPDAENFVEFEIHYHEDES